MATVTSLVCWGGLAGKTATMTINSTCVVTINNHGIRQYNGGTTPATLGIVFSTTGALPTGITAGVTYWARYASVNTFHLYDTEAHALDAGSTTGRVGTTGSQSGTHTAKSAYMLGLTSTQKARYGTSGSERIYNGIAAWRTARAGATLGVYDTEICEIGNDRFTETLSASIDLDLSCYATIIHTRVDGVRSSAFHNATEGSGYLMESGTIDYSFTINILSKNVVVDGIEVSVQNQQGVGGIACDGLSYIVRNCIVRGTGTDVYGITGVRLNSTNGSFYNNVIRSIVGGAGLTCTSYQGTISLYYNNLVTKCTNGIVRDATNSYIAGNAYNNLAVGNVTSNWSAIPSAFESASYNGGESTKGAPWNMGTATGIATMVTSDFAGYSSNNFMPAAKNSRHVRAGLSVYNGYPYDMRDKPRPPYVNPTHRFAYDTESANFTLWETLSWSGGTGLLVALTDSGSTGSMDIHLLTGSAPTDNTTLTGGTSASTCLVNGAVAAVSGEWLPANKWTLGPLEYDFSGPSALLTLTFENIVAGSTYRLTNASGAELAEGTHSSGNLVIQNIAYNGVSEILYFTVRAENYDDFLTNVTIEGTNKSIYIGQVLDI